MLQSPLPTGSLGPEGVRQCLLAYLGDWLGVIDFPAVRAAEAASPHSVDQSQCQVGYEEDDDAVHG